jgi:hypothetical protein
MIAAQMPFRDQVAEEVRRRRPYTLCYACLAASLGLTEEDVRGAAQTLMAGPFTTETRACANCLRTDKLLVVKESAGEAPPGRD